MLQLQGKGTRFTNDWEGPATWVCTWRRLGCFRAGHHLWFAHATARAALQERGREAILAGRGPEVTDVYVVGLGLLLKHTFWRGSLPSPSHAAQPPDHHPGICSELVGLNKLFPNVSLEHRTGRRIL